MMPKTRSKRVTKLSRAVTRRIGKLVVTIDFEGVRFRGKHKRKSRIVTWAQIASLAGGMEPIFVAEETTRGQRELERMGANPTERDSDNGSAQDPGQAGGNSQGQ